MNHWGEYSLEQLNKKSRKSKIYVDYESSYGKIFIKQTEKMK